MAIKKQIDIKVDAKAAIKDTEELVENFELLEDEVVPLKESVKSLEKELKKLSEVGKKNTSEFTKTTKTLKGYKKVLDETDKSLKNTSKLASKDLKNSLGDVTTGVQGASKALGAFGVESDSVEGALDGMRGAMKLTDGIEGLKKGVKAFKLMKNSIMSTSVAQKILSGVTVAFTVVQRALNAAFTANPIGLIVVAVAALTAGIVALIGPVKDLINSFAGVSDSAEKVSEDMERVNGIMEKHNKLIDETIKKSEKRREQDTKRLKLEGASEEELHKNKLKNLKIDEGQRKVVLKDIAKQNKIQYDLLARARKQGSEEDAKTIKKTIESNRDKYKQLKLQDGDYALSVKEAEEEERKRIEQQNKERRARGKQRAADRKAAAESDLQTERELEDLKLANTKDSREKDLKAAILAQKRLLEDLKKDKQIDDEEFKALELANVEALRLEKLAINEKYDDAAQAIKDTKAATEKAAEKARFDREDAQFQLSLQLLKDKQLSEIMLLSLDYDKKFELANGNAELEAQLKEDQALKIAEIEDKFRKEKIEKDKEAEQKKIDALNQGLQDAANALNVLSELNAANEENQLTKIDNRYAAQLEAAEGDERATKKILEKKEKEADKIRKKAFESNKKMQIASAIITGVQSAMSAFSSLASIPVVGPFLGAAAATASAITTGMQIETIKNTQFEGSSGGVVPLPTDEATSSSSAPQFNVVGNSPQNQLAQSLGEGQNQPIQTFVVAGDVTTAQGLDRNIIEASSL
tara:strand:- start:7102 stop:9363 length:2262 start_codon:yes stop_codon:yes gene_type:complete